MDNEIDKEILTPLEKKLFWKFARSHLNEMRLLFRGGRLSKKEGDWNNVIDHCLVQAAEANVFASLLGLPEEDGHKLRVAALCHDWKKRLEKNPEDFTQKQKSKAQELLEKVSPDQNLMKATELGFSKTILEDEASFLQELLFYIDDITRGSQIVELEERISETEARTNLNQDQRITEQLGGPHWDIERLAARQVEQKFYFLLKERGVNIDIPQNIPLLIKKMVDEIAHASPKETTEI